VRARAAAPIRLLPSPGARGQRRVCALLRGVHGAVRRTTDCASRADSDRYSSSLDRPKYARTRARGHAVLVHGPLECVVWVAVAGGVPLWHNGLLWVVPPLVLR